jgi:A/G-specific adenine glycosylase
MIERTQDPVVFRRLVQRWYRAHKRELPWRETRDPYRIWISEVMLQQTTVAAVVPYYERWIEKFPDIETLARADLQAVLKEWQGLGYYQRARNLHAAARVMVDQHNGEIPRDYQTLLALPGFGPYTSAAVLSIAYDLPYPVLDANVRRVCMRLMRLHGQADPGKDDEIRSFLEPHVSARGMGTFNQALMELGALVCRSGNPACLVCPVSHFCGAYAAGEQEVIPRPRRQEYTKLEAVIAVIRKEDRYLIQKRPETGLLAGLWEFPGGKIEPGEEPEQALGREVREELGVELTGIRFLTSVEHAYTQFRVTLHAYACQVSAPPRLRRDTHRWVTLKGMRRFPFPSGSVRLIRFLEKRGQAPFF